MFLNSNKLSKNARIYRLLYQFAFARVYTTCLRNMMCNCVWYIYVQRTLHNSKTSTRVRLYRKREKKNIWWNYASAMGCTYCTMYVRWKILKSQLNWIIFGVAKWISLSAMFWGWICVCGRYDTCYVATLNNAFSE